MASQTLPPETTQFVMTTLQGNLWATLGHSYGLQMWIEYGFKQAKQALGWADYRLTDYAAIERWWEVIMSAYCLVSLHALQWTAAQSDPARAAPALHTRHPWWTPEQNWAQVLTNLRLVLQPFVYFCWLVPWMLVLDLAQLRDGIQPLLAAMNQCHALLPI